MLPFLEDSMLQLPMLSLQSLREEEWYLFCILCKHYILQFYIIFIIHYKYYILQLYIIIIIIILNFNKIL